MIIKMYACVCVISQPEKYYAAEIMNQIESYILEFSIINLLRARFNSFTCWRWNFAKASRIKDGK